MASPTIQQLQTLLDELYRSFAVGQMGRIANVQGADDVVEGATEILASVALDHGVDLGALPETGATVAGVLSTAFRRLAAGAKSVAKELDLRKGLVLTAGSLYVAHDWLTGDTQIALEDLRQKRQAVATALNAASPDDRAAIWRAYLASGPGSGPGIGTVLAVGAAVVGGVWLWRRYAS